MTDIDLVVREIDQDLPEIARRVIRGHLDLSEPSNRDFLLFPDGREQHQTHWHQWGIITHTRTFLRHFDEDIPGYLREWGLWERVDAVLSQPVDEIPRRQLLRVSILLHDIGKFSARTRGLRTFHFMQHERQSGEIIREEIDLERMGLTKAQTEYVARTAEDHFVLGLVRKRARERGQFDLGYIESGEFVEICREIESDHPDDYVEIGVLFFGDSLSKSDPETGPERAVSQYLVNIAVARRYLQLVL